MERRAFIYTFMMSSGGMILHGTKLNAMKPEKDDILIRMIFNNTGSCKGLKNAWGLSVWIEQSNEITLFDTGSDPDILQGNMTYLGLDSSRINRLIISHDHWDHNAGIEMILGKLPEKTNLYMVEQFREDYIKRYPDAQIIGVDEPLQIADHVWSTGSQSITYKDESLYEQSVILTKDNTMVLLTGCSHPGIVKIAKRALEIHPDKTLVLVAGGFHLMRTPENEVREISEELMDLGIANLAPSHCTGDKSIKIFREHWKDRFIDMNLGDQYIL